MTIIYRPARAEDLDAAMGVVQRAFTELRVRNGFGPAPLRSPAFQHFALAEDPTGLWVAETDGEITGFAFSWMRQKFWYLAQLFIRPDLQARGVGQALLSRAFAQAERDGAENRALITLGYNMGSTGLYVRNGLFPCEPLYRLAAPATVLDGRIASDPAYRTMNWNPEAREQSWADAAEEAVIGFRRGTQHAFMQETQGMRTLRIDHAGCPVGYAYISSEGHIGPMLVTPTADEAAVAVACVRAALDGQPRQVSVIVPGRAARILAALSSFGFRIEEPMMLMASKPFGDWSRYVPANPSFM